MPLAVRSVCEVTAVTAPALRLGRALGPLTLQPSPGPGPGLTEAATVPLVLGYGPGASTVEEQFHCFDAFTGSGSGPPYSDEYSQI